MSDAPSALRAIRLRCEHLNPTLGLNSARPRFTWSLGGQALGQSACRLLIGEDRDAVASGRADLWDSGRREMSGLGASYDGPPLPSDRHLWWSVQLWDEAGRPAPIPDPAELFTGLFAEDWQAEWIARPFVPAAGRPVPQDDAYDNRFQARPVDYLRRELHLPNAPVRATAYTTALGLYEFYVNGTRIGSDVLAPGWTDYHTRAEYQVHDVTGHLRAGGNALGAILGEGWYSGRVGHNQRRAGNHYGGRPAFLCQIHLHYADGTRQVLRSDDGWTCARGPILYSDFLAGEAFDARKEMSGWSAPGYDDADWQPVETGDPEPRAPELNAARAQPIREVERLGARELGPCGSERIYDLGQNIAGYCELKITAEPGTRIRLRHAERLTEDGALYTENLRYAVSEDVYIARGGGEEVYTPRFTFHGFQYVGLTVESGALLAEPALTGIALQTDMPRTGEIDTGNALLNKLLSNIFWSQRDNFIAVPTDCPQRDERYGWTADAQVFWRTAGFNMETTAFATKYLEDLIDGQSPEGAFPDVAPTKPLNPYRLTPQPGAPGWGDGPIIIAWHDYLRTGRTDLLHRAWEPFVAWMDYIEAANPDGVRLNRVNNNYGDWLNVGPRSDPALVASAYWVHIADLMGKIAGVLGRDRTRWHLLAARLRASFRGAFADSEGRLSGDTQTAYLLALDFGLLEDRSPAVARLGQLLEEAGWHLQTGFLGVRHVCPVVADELSERRAVDLLLKESFPSWGFSIRHGATTTWERWDGWTPERGFQSASMNSFNHYSFGSVGEWIWSRLAGIDWDEAAPGFASIRMRPIFDERIGHLAARYDAPSGRIESAWQIDGATGRWTVSIPPGATAAITLPRTATDPTLAGAPLQSAPLGPGAHVIEFGYKADQD
ncbi:family 78 glycoside hydrolase catalytic domain [Tropicimonas sp. IMCC34011]|uniref:family 78 glycoside hydrolase catalytic domain n=1 Tax=Tropicimonas sp. IMCC34011 TaxID=2248759 RepID=UPI0018E5740E|nr:family 78 glycoside hydrolase catalytic domain [Tropicimonas sp. IMCC34011]